MRSCHINGNGSQCDICHTILDPFETYRLVGKILQPGPRYPDITSDTRYKNINNFHLCENCYNKVIADIKVNNFCLCENCYNKVPADAKFSNTKQKYGGKIK